MPVNIDRHTILTLLAIGRITPAEAERLLAAWSESREIVWLLTISLVIVCLTQFNVHSLVPALMHIFNAQMEGFR